MATEQSRRPGRKATKAQQEQRVGEIHRLLLMQVPRRGILQHTAKWNLSVRSIDALIARATGCIERSAVIDRALELGMAVGQIKDLYSKAIRIQDYKMALAARRELSGLLGLYVPTRPDPTDPEDGTLQYIALIPEPAKDNAAWSAQCLKEQAARDRQRTEQPQPPTGIVPA